MWDGGDERVDAIRTVMRYVEKKFERFCQSHVFHWICLWLFAFGRILFGMSVNVDVDILCQMVLVDEFLDVDVGVVS